MGAQCCRMWRRPFTTLKTAVIAVQTEGAAEEAEGDERADVVAHSATLRNPILSHVLIISLNSLYCAPH